MGLVNKLAILLDFDGTITEHDIGDQVVIKFGTPGWEQGLERFKRGEITVRGLWMHEASHLRASDREAMERFVLETAIIRRGLPQLLAFAQERGIPVEVASSGFGFYIRAILGAAGLASLPVASPELVFDDAGAGRAHIPEQFVDCTTTAMCKCDRLRRLRDAGHRVLFVGDGVSDNCVAREADHLMARATLATFCDTEGIPYRPFDTFFDVIEEAKRLSALR